jgi:hypothetical protein
MSGGGRRDQRLVRPEMVKIIAEAGARLFKAAGTDIVGATAAN